MKRLLEFTQRSSSWATAALAAFILAFSVITCAVPVHAESLYRIQTQNANPAVVMTNYLCERLDSVMVTVEAFSRLTPQDVGDWTPPRGCGFPVSNSIPFNIHDIIAGPYVDWEGDTFFVVDLGDGLYTIAYPGINSNLTDPNIGDGA